MALYTNIKGPVNYTIVGSLTIENGIVSGFSSTNYLNISDTETINEHYELCFKFKLTTSSLSIPTVILNFRNNAEIVRMTAQIDTERALWLWFRYNDTNNQLLVNTSSGKIEVNKWYYVKFIWNKPNIRLLLSTDNIIWELLGSGTSNVNSLTIPVNTIGNRDLSTERYFRGEIDLNESYIIKDNKLWFGKSFSKVKLHSPTAISYTKKGNPTITSDGVASGFTDKNDYLILGAFNPGTSKWKFTTKVKIYDYTAQISLIDRNSSTRCFQIVVRTTGKFRVNISTNGSSKANEVDGTHVLSVNTIYYICFEYDGSKYYLKYSLDNINWTTDITINNSTKIYPVSSMCMGHSWYNSGTEKWNGEIYLRYTRFEIDGVTNDKYKLHALEGDYAIVDGKLVWANPNIYLQSSGTQYIDTGMGVNGNITFDVKYSITNSTGTPAILGCRTGSSTPTLVLFQADGGRFDYGTSRVTIGRVGSRVGDYKISTKIENGTYYLYKGTTLIGSKSTQTFTQNNNLYLFSINKGDGTGANNAFTGNIKFLKVWNNGIQVRNLVPVPTGMVIGDFTVPSNGMFDIVNQQFYPNQGTGTFTYGKDS